MRQSNLGGTDPHRSAIVAAGKRKLYQNYYRPYGAQSHPTQRAPYIPPPELTRRRQRRTA